MSKNNIRFNDGSSVKFPVEWYRGDEHCLGEVTLNKADGGLWLVILKQTNMVRDGKPWEDEGEDIGAIADGGWEYSDQSSTHPGFWALTGWSGSEPGDMICDNRQSQAQGCRNLTQAAKVVWKWYTLPHYEQLAKTADWLQGNPKPAPKRVEPEPLSDALKLANCLAWIRDEVMHNDRLPMSQRSKPSTFLDSIGA